jgi:competence protein ComEA
VPGEYIFIFKKGEGNMNFKIFGREIFVNKLVLIFICAVLIVILGSIGIYIAKKDSGIVFEDTGNKANVSPVTSSGSTATVSTGSSPSPENHEDEIKVYITGCVKKPGIVTLKKGQLIDDAIKAAGGPTEDADLNFNMVYELNENVWIIVKSKNEKLITASNKPDTGNLNSSKKPNPSKPNQSKPSTPKPNSPKPDGGNDGVVIIKDSGGVIVGEKGVGGADSNSKININTASVAELDKLPGIGEKIAMDIIAFREKNGNFKSIKDIEKVPGIGQSKFNSIKDLITVN